MRMKTTTILCILFHMQAIFGYRSPHFFEDEERSERYYIAEHRRHEPEKEDRYYVEPEIHRPHIYDEPERGFGRNERDRELELRREMMLERETEMKLERRKIEQCEIDMENCPYSAEELVEKILELEDDEWKEDLTNEEYFPDIEDSREGSRGEMPGLDSISPLMPSRDSRRKFHESIERNSGVSRYCRPNCVRHRSSGKYKIECRDYLKDRSIRYFYQRKRKMINCYKCRTECSRANVKVYI